MSQIVLETADGLPAAIAFANRQFGLDFTTFQPKLYCHEDAGGTITVRNDCGIVGMASFYPVICGSLRCLSVGTICTDPQFRRRGIMTELFSFMAQEIFPHYDIITLCGKRTRYEHFGFAKALWFPEYWFYPEAETNALTAIAVRRQDGAALLSLWQRYGTGVLRDAQRMTDILKSAGHEAYLISDGTDLGYFSGHRRKGIITEYCGPWPAEMIVNKAAALWGNKKIGMLGKTNSHDPNLLESCDSYIIRNHGNIRIQAQAPEMRDVYKICGHGGAEPTLKLPSSLVYLDGI